MNNHETTECFVCGKKVKDGDSCDRSKNGYCQVSLIQCGKDKVTFNMHSANTTATATATKTCY